jgi:hypothetical protein
MLKLSLSSNRGFWSSAIFLRLARTISPSPRPIKATHPTAEKTLASLFHDPRVTLSHSLYPVIEAGVCDPGFATTPVLKTWFKVN